jgi:hypothetical protein
MGDAPAATAETGVDANATSGGDSPSAAADGEGAAAAPPPDADVPADGADGAAAQETAAVAPADSDDDCTLQAWLGASLGRPEWGDALRECGFPNTVSLTALDDDLLEELSCELAEVRRGARAHTHSPHSSTLARRSKTLARALAERILRTLQPSVKKHTHDESTRFSWCCAA